MPEDVEKILTFTIELEEDSAVVACHGRLVAGETDAFYHEVRQLVSDVNTVVVDLEKLTYIDSMGLGTLVRLRAAAKKSGCEFKLLHLGKQVRNLLTLTNLLTFFGQVEDHGITIA
jgi:anti-sigma B factor antagonist